MNFKDLKISDELIDTLKKNGIKTPTPIQEESILLIKNNKDILAQSQTGTGKTLAFLIPVFDSISAKNENIQALILAPTRELAIQIYNEAEKLNKDKTVNGILLQSPIPSNLDINEAFRTISPQKDVDGFNPVNVGKLVLNQDTFVSCTPYGIMKMFEKYNIDLTGKNVVILGRSNIVGKPLMHCCLNKNATVTVCHSKTQNLAQKAKEADILISAIGKAQFVTADMVKENAVVIDVGINRLENGKITGDVDFENVKEKASYITPVPGGVGPMTIAMLMNNVIKATKRQNGMID